MKDAIERAYAVAGWDMNLSTNSIDSKLFPTFDDVLAELNEVIRSSDYSADTKGDYIGSLSTRLKSMTNGINGRIFSSSETDLDRLFNETVILDISRVGSMETKALIMGLVILKLQEYRMSHATEMNAALKHLTVLEEAHNLLKKTSTEQSAESSNVQGKSVEMLTNSVAEMRTYGEGFIIVDQAPDLLDTAAIRNTNTKIVFRLPEGSDRNITGAAMALSDKQTREISKFPTGIAAVYQNDWQEAVLCKLPKFEPSNREATPRLKKGIVSSQKEHSDKLLHDLLKDAPSARDATDLKESIIKSNASARIKKDLILGLGNHDIAFDWAIADYINKNYVFDNVFHGTGNGQCGSLQELGERMMANIAAVFASFNEDEKKKILCYICMLKHEQFPDNVAIEALQIDLIKKGVI